MSPVLSAETWAIAVSAVAIIAVTLGIRWFWRRHKDVGDL